MAKLDLKGQVFGRLTVIQEAGRNSRKEVLWKCKCICGKTTSVTTYRLRKGITKSCGCLNIDTDKRGIEKLGELNKTHGMSKTRVYKTYCGIKERCLNTNSKKYPDYGGRGITMSEEWSTFESFYEWSKENGYNDKLTLDRIDVDGNYEPINCRWVDMKVQNNNRRINRYIEFNGQRKTLAQWAEEYGLKAGTLSARLDRQGLGFEEAITLKSFDCISRARGKKVRVTDIETGEIRYFNSLKESFESLGGNQTYSAIRYCFQKGKIYLNKFKIDRDM